ncbi:uncharacterized protein [Equus przewalskii]|uniref:Uncharacterized protein isoform X1 n=1 Tax=Equus przewalskii TaxID=9798 RepID=A0ABM4NKD6_EQUPR
MRGARALPGAAAGGRGSPRPCCGPRAPGTTPRRLPRRRGRVAGRGAQALPLGAARRRHSGGRMWAPACFQRGVPAAPAPPGAGLSLPRSPFRRGDARRTPRFTSDMTATRSPPPPPCTGLACPDSGNPQRPLPRPRELRASKQKRRRSVTPSLPSNSPPTSMRKQEETCACKGRGKVRNETQVQSYKENEHGSNSKSLEKRLNVVPTSDSISDDSEAFEKRNEASI